MHCAFTVRRFGLRIRKICSKMRVFLSLLLYRQVVVSIAVVYPPERLNNMLMSLLTYLPFSRIVIPQAR